MVKTEIRTFVGNRIDTTSWPLILWESLPGAVPDAEVARVFEHVAELLRAAPPETKTFTVNDLSLMKEAPPPSTRRACADFMTSHEALLRRTAAGGALVITSTVLRSAVSAIFWIRPSPVPTRVFSTREEAMARAAHVLERANGTVPPRLQALRRHVTKVA
jgi:hypothetical protein